MVVCVRKRAAEFRNQLGSRWLSAKQSILEFSANVSDTRRGKGRKRVRPGEPGEGTEHWAICDGASGAVFMTMH